LWCRIDRVEKFVEGISARSRMAFRTPSLISFTFHVGVFFAGGSNPANANGESSFMLIEYGIFPP
jgi:hypothetical protein